MRAKILNERFQVMKTLLELRCRLFYSVFSTGWPSAQTAMEARPKITPTRARRLRSMRRCRASRTAGAREHRGFTMLELLLVVLILGIIAAFAIPQALNAVKAYRLHSDASAVASQFNVARFRTTSQNAPYRVNIQTSTNPPSFELERLCGSTPASVDSNCTSPYQPFSTVRIESGAQYLSTGTRSPPRIPADPLIREELRVGPLPRFSISILAGCPSTAAETRSRTAGR